MRLFSKGVPGLDNKDCPMAWRMLGFVTCQIGPLQVVTKLYHLHAFLSLVCLKMLGIKKHLGAKDNSFQYMRCVLFCVNNASTDSCVSDTRETPERANTWSMSNYLSWQVTLAIIHLYWIYILEYRCTDQQNICLFYFRASSVLCLHTSCAVGTRARHTYTHTHTHTHTVYTMCER